MLQAANFISEGGVRALQLYQRNRTYHIPISDTSPSEIIFKPEDIEKINAIVATCLKDASRYPIKSKDLIKRLSKIMMQRGSCHGICLFLISNFMKSPDVNIGQYYQKLHQHGSDIAYFQALDIIRGTISRRLSSNKRQCIDESFRKSYFPQMDINVYHFSDGFSAFFEALKKNRENGLLVRCWNGKRPLEAHTLFYCCSEKNKNYGFYNSKGIGGFVFPDPEMLAQEFEQHLKVFFDDIFEKQGVILVERKALQ